MSRGGSEEGLNPSLPTIKQNNLSHFLNILSLLLNESSHHVALNFQGFEFFTGIIFQVSFQGLIISVVV